MSWEYKHSVGTVMKYIVVVEINWKWKYYQFNFFGIDC